MTLSLPKTSLLGVLLFSLPLTCSGQLDETFSRVVLDANFIDSTFVFGYWTPMQNDSSETHLTYLGKVDGPGTYYKVMTSILYWGASSRRATSRILIFDECDNYIGNFSLTMTWELPEEILDGKIMFYQSKSDECDPDLVTTLGFETGIPKHFFLPCTCATESGTFYGFDEGLY